MAGLGVGFGLANLLGTSSPGGSSAAGIGGLDGPAVASSLVRMHVATMPAALFAFAVSLMVGVVSPAGHLGAFVILAAGRCWAACCSTSCSPGRSASASWRT